LKKLAVLSQALKFDRCALDFYFLKLNKLNLKNQRLKIKKLIVKKLIVKSALRSLKEL